MQKTEEKLTDVSAARTSSDIINLEELIAEQKVAYELIAEQKVAFELIAKLKVAFKTNKSLNELLGLRNKKIEDLSDKLDTHERIFSSVLKVYPLDYIEKIAECLELAPIELFIPSYTPSATIAIFSLDGYGMNHKSVVSFAEEYGLFKYPFKAKRIFRMMSNEAPSSSTVVFSILGALDILQYKKEEQNGKKLFDESYDEEEAKSILKLA